MTITQPFYAKDMIVYRNNKQGVITDRYFDWQLKCWQYFIDFEDEPKEEFNNAYTPRYTENDLTTFPLELMKMVIHNWNN